MTWNWDGKPVPLPENDIWDRYLTALPFYSLHLEKRVITALYRRAIQIVSSFWMLRVSSFVGAFLSPLTCRKPMISID